MIESGSELFTVTDRAKAYIAQLNAIAEAEAGGIGLGEPGSSPISGSTDILAARITASEENARILNRITEDFGVNLRTLREEARNQPKLMLDISRAIISANGDVNAATRNIATVVRENEDLGVLGPFLEDFLANNPSRAALVEVGQFLGQINLFC